MDIGAWLRGLSLGRYEQLFRDKAGPPRAGGESVAWAMQPLPVSAERRQLTVVFVDLVGSTALSARLDPEARTGAATGSGT